METNASLSDYYITLLYSLAHVLLGTVTECVVCTTNGILMYQKSKGKLFHINILYIRTHMQARTRNVQI